MGPLLIALAATAVLALTLGVLVLEVAEHVSEVLGG